MTPKSSSRTPVHRVPTVGVDAVGQSRLILNAASMPVVSPSRARELVRTCVPSYRENLLGSPRRTPTVRTIPVRSRRSRSSGSPQDPQAWEVVCRIGVNILLTTAAISGLHRLLPVQLAQYHRLQVLEQQIEVLKTRVSRLQEGVDRGMDPLQQEALIKERLNKVPANQIQVRLVPPATLVASDEDEAGPSWIGQSREPLPIP
ncbi:MAG: hypothetical protein Q6K55_04260 [Thermostichus sp. DG02_3_bins_51]